MSHEVRTHVRTVNGRSVTVRSHTRDDDGAASQDDAGDSWEHDTSDEDGKAQRKRHAFERRVQAEQLRGRQQTEARYEVKATTRTPGERKKRKKSGVQRARHHVTRARRLARRHQWKALGHLGMAAFWSAAHGARKLRSRQ